MDEAVKLSIQKVSKAYTSDGHEVRAIDEISLEIRNNEFATILGPSGCGKSTLLRIVAGLLKPTRGVVRLDGKVIGGPGQDRGMVFQSYTLFPWLTVKENIQFGLEICGMPRATQEQIAREFVERVGLRGFEETYPKALSGGMKQRVAIARALANNPAVLLLDEPFGALDAQTRALMQELLTQVWEELHKTILFVTHDVEEAIFLSDRVFVMTARPGRVKAEIPIPLERPRSYEVKATETFLTLKKQALRLIREEAIKATQFKA
ncbi:MAG: ABC transporter ATP-binding protein [candidate division NC10 bacterium]|nr:ABC transporter ATP-binding protein [candidate division NC10 bacterium]